MLKRLYAHNYRCFVNFEFHFKDLTLLLGPNGSGKSSLFDLLSSLRHLIFDGDRVQDAFPYKHFTGWNMNGEGKQTFELEVHSTEGSYRYTINISYLKERNLQRIEKEELTFDGHLIYKYELGEIQLFRDNYSTGPKYDFDWTLSGLAHIHPASENKKLTRFKNWIDQLFMVRLNPHQLSDVSEKESSWLNPDCSNFASWYRWLTQEHPDRVMVITERLREVFEGFHILKLEPSGNQKLLKAVFHKDGEGKPISLDISQLSDGQRVLMVLYSLIHGLKEEGVTLLLDEPENFVSLREIQPLMMELKESEGNHFLQTVLISHHPELIDLFGSDHGVWLDREGIGPTRVKPLPERNPEGLLLSELIARGWVE